MNAAVVEARVRPRLARGAWLAGAALLVLVAALVSACVGATRVGALDALAQIGRALTGAGSDLDRSSALDRTYAVVVQIRLPRIVAALCVGASLGAAGCMLQALLRNPLASPFVIGTSSAASFGAVLGIFLGLAHAPTLASSFAFALGGGALVLALARVRGRLPSESVVLNGFAVGLVFSAGTGLLQYFAVEEAQLREMVLWLLGGLWRTTWEPLAIHAPLAVVAVLAALTLSRELDLLSLGEADAQRLGVDVARARTLVLVVSCVLTSLAVSLGGVIAFVGLIVPHLARRLVGATHATLLPACAIGGAGFLVVADTLARTAFIPHEVPLGIVTSLVGAPTFLVLLRRQRGKEAFL